MSSRWKRRKITAQENPQGQAVRQNDEEAPLMVAKGPTVTRGIPTQADEDLRASTPQSYTIL